MIARSAVLLGSFALLLARAVGASDAKPDSFRIDPVHTQVLFSAVHQGFSHPVGRIKVKEGWFAFDPKDWSKSEVDATIDLATLDLGDPKWNAAVLGGPFLDAKSHPLARFRSRSVEQRSPTTGVVHGDLTLRGVTRPVDLEVTFNRLANDPYAFGRKAGFSAHTSVARGAFGMTRYKEVVGEDIDVRIEVEGLRDRHAGETADEPLDAEDKDDGGQK